MKNIHVPYLIQEILKYLSAYKTIQQIARDLKFTLYYTRSVTSEDVKKYVSS